MTGGPDDNERIRDASNLLQSELWARFKSGFGWTARRVAASDGPWKGLPILVLVRRIAPGISLAYAPFAPPFPEDPVLPEERARALALVDLAASIADWGRGRLVRPVCVRFDLPWPVESMTQAPVRGFRRAPADVQPASTVILDLRQSEDELLAAMHKKNRYNIRLAERKGVSVRQGDESELPKWYKLYRETAARDRITIHPLAYYQRLFELARSDDSVEMTLYCAEHDDDMLAGIIVARAGDRATYLYGASSDRKRNLMPNYALQWRAIQQAKDAGALWYDLFGVPSADDPHHPMHGLFRFKTGFGGELVHMAGSWDVVTAPLRYSLYRIAERARVYYYHRVRKAGAR